MKKEDIFEALGGIDADAVLSAAPNVKKRKKIPFVLRIVAAALAMVIIISAVIAAIVIPKIMEDQNVILPSPSPYRVLAIANYPSMEMAPKKGNNSVKAYQSWRSDVAKRSDVYTDLDVLVPFFSDAAEEFLGDHGDKNVVFSPLSIYMTLAMMGETSNGEVQADIFERLGVPNITHLRAQASRIWNGTYRDDGAIKSLVANSIWLRDGYEFNQAPLDSLAEHYYASSYAGDMDSEDFKEQYCKWINESSGNEFDMSIDSVPWDEYTDICISSAMYFSSKWNSIFESTEKGIFHAKNADVSADFMTDTVEKDFVYYGENFCAVAKRLESLGYVWFILPDESVSVDDVLSSGNLMDFLIDSKAREKKQYKITMNIPKFSISTESDITDKMKKIIPTSVFENGTSALCDGVNVNVSGMVHGASLEIDESGIVGATYNAAKQFLTGIEYPAKDEIIITYDVPFIVAVTSAADVPLFLGVINDPTK